MTTSPASGSRPDPSAALGIDSPVGFVQIVRGCSEPAQAAAGPSSNGVHIIHTMTSAEVLRTLRADGWTEVARKGSHVQLKHPGRTGRVTVPHPTKDLPVGTLKSIERQAGIRLVTRK